jgi:phosphosulfolactate synthase
METELQAGAWKVIAEARESGTVGIFRGSGEVRSCTQ